MYACKVAICLATTINFITDVVILEGISGPLNAPARVRILHILIRYETFTTAVKTSPLTL